MLCAGGADIIEISVPPAKLLAGCRQTGTTNRAGVTAGWRHPYGKSF